MGKILTARLGACAMALLLVACGADSERRAITDAKTALQKRDLATARIQLKNALEKNPNAAEARFLFGKLLLEAGEVPTAEIELRKALELKHPIDDVAPLLARALLATQQHAKIIEDYAALKLADPNRQADLSAAVAMAYAAMGHRDKAAALVATVLERTPDNEPTRLVQARLAVSGGDVRSALQVVDRVLAREANNLEALQLRGDLLLFGAQDRTAAVAAYRKVLEVQKDNLYSNAQIISIFLENGDKRAATAQFDSLAKLNLRHPLVQILGAQVALINGEAGRAKELTDQLMRVTKDEPTVLVAAAMAAFDLNSLTQAEAYLNKVLAKLPNSAPARRLMAMVQMRSGEPAKALDVLRPLVDSGNPDSASLTLAAEAHLASGDAKGAEVFFARLAKLKPDDIKARTALALVRIGKGEREAALAELRSIAASDKGTLADMAVIDVRRRQGDFDGALSAIDALERKLPGKALPADLRGRIFLLKRDSASARASFETALKRDPVYLPSVATLATMDLADAKPDEAAQRFQAVLKSDPKNVQALVALARLKAREKASPAEIAQLLGRAIESRPSEPATHLLLVDHWLRQANPKQALTAAQAGLAANPDSFALLDAVGRAQLASGAFAEGLATFGKIALQQPKSALAQLSLANAHLRAKNPDAAERALRKLLEISPDLLAAQRALTVLAVQAKQPNRALQVARAIQQQRPKDALGYLFEGDVHVAFKDFAAAERSFRAGLSKEGGGIAAEKLHVLLEAAGRKADAERFAADWIKQNPNDVRIRTQLGALAEKAGDFARAETHFREVVKLDPLNPIATNDLAWALVKQRKPGAVQMAERALALGPESPIALDTLAVALAEEGQFGKAVEASKSAVRLAPDRTDLRLNLAKFQIRAGDKMSAKAELDELAKPGADVPQRKEVAELMKAL